MHLEDHLGDIIHKGRLMTNVSAAAAARAAKVSERELGAVEESGENGSGLDLAALAQVLGLNASKLAGIAGNWLPRVPNLDRWRHLRPFTTSEGGNAVHCYLIWDEETREAALFDTGWDPTPVYELIKASRLELRHLFITHTHHDHVAGLKDIRAHFQGIHVHTDLRSAPAGEQNRRDETVELGRLRISNRGTPGHAEDGVTYLVDGWPGGAPRVAIVGDTIFAGSMGGGFTSWDLARGKVRDEILTLAPDTLLCPGHGPLTTVAEENEHNPFF